ALREGGVVCVEVTMTVPNALEGIRAVSDELGDAVLVGAGSVIDGPTAQAAIDAGARYVVSPVFKREVIDAAHAMGAAAMPGCFTPTEILAAHEAGADVAKVFPAGSLGPGFIRGVLAPMPHLRLMPTGGVSLTNAGD
ncbi:MAG TPA: bifunctional 4-hydroxy-2-oxoglutarate aldolase/2-dehydro-3-deoxy-phosphogluconate aldolase, partial [Bacteroidetes bacterium]|nr:bifunctional 4-hydroxy-2-oxoglutarate aldolase/2-dehydro-3-deoxy-phosphogluconate aldolase [Bacteroidota bacterium]